MTTDSEIGGLMEVHGLERDRLMAKGA